MLIILTANCFILLLALLCIWHLKSWKRQNTRLNVTFGRSDSFILSLSQVNCHGMGVLSLNFTIISWKNLCLFLNTYLNGHPPFWRKCWFKTKTTGWDGINLLNMFYPLKKVTINIMKITTARLRSLKNKSSIKNRFNKKSFKMLLILQTICQSKVLISLFCSSCNFWSISRNKKLIQWLQIKIIVFLWVK